MSWDMSNPLVMGALVVAVLGLMRGLDAYLFDFKKLVMVRVFHRWIVCENCNGVGVNLKERKK